MPVLLAMCAIGLIAFAPHPASAQPRYTRLSVTPGGTQPSNISYTPVLSGNGRFVAFSSAATDLVANDTNGKTDVFVRDLLLGITTRVSVDSQGQERPAESGTIPFDNSAFVGVSLSHDGTIVAFQSRASFAADDVNQPCAGFTDTCNDVYVHDRGTGQTTRVSVSSTGTQGDGASGDPQVSADGRYVLFSSYATNLVPNDTNFREDVFLHDRLTHTTTRVSRLPNGQQNTGESYGGSISRDGRIITFLLDPPFGTSDLGPTDPVGCTGSVAGCTRALVVDREAGTVTPLPLPVSALQGGASVRGVVVSPDGRLIASHIWHKTPSGITTVVAVYDRLTGQTEVELDKPGQRGGYIAFNSTATIVSVGNGLPQLPALAFNRQTRTELTIGESSNLASFPAPQFSGDGFRMVFSNENAYAVDDTNGLYDVYQVMIDQDNDGLPDGWETQVGLDPTNAADATQDSDTDGVSNRAEYFAGTHPRGTVTRYFAEGAANAFFTTRFALFNPGAQTATTVVEFLGANGVFKSMPVTLAPHGWYAITLDDTTSLQPDNDFSTVIESDQPIVADRTMSWDKTGYGSHAETSMAAPSTTWYLAEGSTGGAFDLFYLLQNPGDVAANVTVHYLLPAPQAPIVKPYVVGPKSRLTIYVDQEGGVLAGTDVSAKIIADQPILAERSMYFSTPTQPFAAGHEGAAVDAPATSWFFAEGATGSFFDLFLLLANAEATDATVQVTYLLPSGAPIIKTYTVPAQSRVTINVDFEDPALKDTPVSSIVESKNGVPIIAERAMWWPSPDWYEAHLSAGATTTGTRWALADGLVSTAAGTETETYILIANTSDTAGTADVTVYPDGAAPITKTYDIAAHSRTNVPVSVDFPATANRKGFGTLIQSSGPPIVVERAIYTNANGQTWAAGSDALGTRLQ